MDIKKAYEDFRANREALNEAQEKLEAAEYESDDFYAANEAVGEQLQSMPRWQRYP